MKKSFFLFLAACLGAVAAWAGENCIKRGSATINISFTGDHPAVDGVVLAATPFSENHEPDEYPFVATGQGLSCTFPLLTKDAYVGIRLMGSEMPYAIGIIRVSQDQPLDIVATYYPENDYMAFDLSNKEGINRFKIGPDDDNITPLLGRAYQTMVSLDLKKALYEESGLISPECYESWERLLPTIEPVVRYEFEVAGMDELDLPELQPWLANSMRRYAICQGPMNFVREAKLYGLFTENPPIEFYKFIDTLDLTDGLLDFFPDLPPYYLLKQILLKVPGIEPIGEAPVDQWTARARAVLSQITTQPIDLLLELMPVAAYLEQLRQEGKPLTSLQAANIEAGCSADLAAYLLEQNQRLEQSLAFGSNLYDLSAEAEFSLADFIDTRYPGRPVVVDIWNTWCQPCRRAHAEVEPLRRLPECEGVVFLYISDDSSPIEEWATMAPQIGGEQVRISQAQTGALFDALGLEGLFPTYLFYTPAHTLSKSIAAFPGPEEYLRQIQAIKK